MMGVELAEIYRQDPDTRCKGTGGLDNPELAEEALAYVLRMGLGPHFLQQVDTPLTRHETGRLAHTKLDPLTNPHHQNLYQYVTDKQHWKPHVELLSTSSED